MILSVLIAVSVNAQDAGIEEAFASLVADFEASLRQNEITSFIDAYSITDAELQALVDEENRNMGLSEDDPSRFTFIQSRELMQKMAESLNRTFFNGIEAVRIISGIESEALKIDDFRVKKSYWEPVVAEITLIVKERNNEVEIVISNLSLVMDTPKLGPSTRIEFRHYQPQNIVFHHILTALRTHDSEYYAEKVIPDKQGIIALLEASAESGGYSLADFDQEELYRLTRERGKAAFQKLLKEGDEKGIIWGGIENVWSGYSASLQDKVYQSNIPFEFTYAGETYRIVLDYCSQLALDPAVFLPGEFIWE